MSRGLARKLRDAALANKGFEDASFGVAAPAGNEWRAVRRRVRKPRDIAVSEKQSGDPVFGAGLTRPEFDT